MTQEQINLQALFGLWHKSELLIDEVSFYFLIVIV